ncbi:MAG TPA: hypothetical protein VGG07_16640 [Solirubrobacteraceae bacterium]|jgi:hypothetical protein
MASTIPFRSGSWTRTRLAQAGVGLGVAASVLSGAAVATAATHAPAPKPVAHAAQAKVPYSSVAVAPGIARAGQHITISGNAPKNAHAGQWITLQSFAFAAKQGVNGVPSVRTQVLVNGKYTAKATVRAGLKPTSYAIMGTFQGKALDTVAWVKVSSRTARPYSSVTVSSSTVRSGQRITISGNGPKNAPTGSWITLQSDAFASSRTVNGVPAIRTQVLVNGEYSAKATIRNGLKPTTYAVMGTFKGKALDTVAWMTVR